MEEDGACLVNPEGGIGETFSLDCIPRVGAGVIGITNPIAGCQLEYVCVVSLRP